MTTGEIYAEMGFGSEIIDDPYRLFQELRRETPVREGDVMIEFGAPSFTAPGDSRPKFTLFRYDDIAGALRDPGTFSSTFWEAPRSGNRASNLAMDGEEHRAWRTILTPVFGRKALTTWDEDIFQPIAHRCAQDLAAAGKSADLVEYAHRFSMHMTYEIMGFESDDPDAFERFQDLALTLLLTLVVNPDPRQMKSNVERATKAGKELFDWVIATVERKRSEGAVGSDLISHAIRAQLASGEVDDEQIALFIRTILSGATENTTRQFLNTLTCLLELPELLSAVRKDRTLLPPALIEGERYETPALTVPRLANRELELRGTVIPAGAFLLLVIGSANRDPDTFSSPETFDIHRGKPSPLTFGLGPHVCPGMNLARVQIDAGLTALLDRLPNLRLDPDREHPRIVGAPFRWPKTLPVVWD